MTTCNYCLSHMAARTQEQLEHRKAMAAKFPNVQFSECPRCKGTEWGLTDVMVQPQAPKLSLWARIRAWWQDSRGSDFNRGT